MSFLQNIRKTIQVYINPNQNPTEVDKNAFKLLEQIKVEEFVEYVKEHNVNVNAVMFNGLTMLTKAVEIANNEPKEGGLSREDILSRAVIAINFLIDKGINIDAQDKTGRTALLSAAHWQQEQIVELLIKHEADLDLATTQTGWITNPLVASLFKQNYRISQALVKAGANIEYAIQLTMQPNGFKLSDKAKKFLKKVQNIKKILLAKKLEEKSTISEKLLSKLSSHNLLELIENC